MNRKNKRANDQSIIKLANAAFRKATQKAIELAERTGTPVIVWEDGAVKEVDPRTLRLKMNGRAGKKIVVNVVWVQPEYVQIDDDA